MYTFHVTYLFMTHKTLYFDLMMYGLFAARQIGSQSRRRQGQNRAMADLYIYRPDSAFTFTTCI